MAKLTPEEKAKKEAIRLEEWNVDRLKDELAELRAKKFLPKPTRFYEVGERVILGNLTFVHIKEVLDDNLIYLVHIESHTNPYGGKTVIEHSDRYVDWLDIEKYITPEDNKKIDVIVEKTDLDIRINNQHLEQLLFHVYNNGVDFEPDYQRGLVWSMEYGR